MKYKATSFVFALFLTCSIDLPHTSSVHSRDTKDQKGLRGRGPLRRDLHTSPFYTCISLTDIFKIRMKLLKLSNCTWDRGTTHLNKWTGEKPKVKGHESCVILQTQIYL